MSNLFEDLLGLVYPNLCVICGENLVRGEKMICINCLHSLPRTHYHLVPDNTVEKRFWGKVPLYRATSFYFFYKGSPYQKLLHELKYRGNREIGEVMGKHAAIDLIASPDFCTVDVIIPVPLHPKKLAKRGYNQSECIANGIAAVIKKPIDNTNLIRTRENQTQTRKSIFDRYSNTKGIFSLKCKNMYREKHVLLVDDVLTTGSTLEACMLTLMQTEHIKISVFTLALA
jgi:ComF family protein